MNGRERLIGLYPEVIVLANRVLTDMTTIGHPMLVAAGMRTFEDQAKLYAQGRTAPGNIVTNADAGYSWHNYGLAWDGCFESHDLQNSSGEHWGRFALMSENHGFLNGSIFKSIKDYPHNQRTYGMHLTDVRELYLRGGLRAVWIAVDKIRGVKPGSGWDMELRLKEQDNA